MLFAGHHRKHGRPPGRADVSLVGHQALCTAHPCKPVVAKNEVQGKYKVSPVPAHAAFARTLAEPWQRVCRGRAGSPKGMGDLPPPPATAFLTRGDMGWRNEGLAVHSPREAGSGSCTQGPLQGMRAPPYTARHSNLWGAGSCQKALRTRGSAAPAG